MKVGIIGAGTMGSGIAQAFAQAEGYEVYLCDINEEFAANGKKKIAAGLEKRVAKVKAVANGVGVDFAYQCTGAPAAAADIYSYIRRGGGMCEMGFFVNNGEYQVNPHLAMCNKEINIVGSWDYSAEDYPKTMAFLKQCKEMNIPIEDLITHSFPLDQMNEAMETNVAQKGIKICYIAK